MLPTTNKEFYDLVGNEKLLIEFLVDNKIVPKKAICPNVNCKLPKDNHLVFYENRLHYKCYWYKCKRRWAVNSNIFNLFHESKLSTAKILEIIWYWAWNTTAIETALHTKNDRKTIYTWFKKIRNVCQLNLMNAPAMGGPEWQIQIDESLFQGRRKYNRGRLRKGDKRPTEDLELESNDEWRDLEPTNKRNYGKRVSGPWVFGLVAQRISDIANDAELKLSNKAARKGVIRRYQSKAERRALYKYKYFY